ncbi:MAG: GNAT family N-acetyltransferase [Rhodobacterales bacterium]|nr:GNAT family N-acetyltransferase [Rhodobacterales bacterium]
MDVIWDRLRRSEWQDAIGAAALQQQWDYGAVAARLGGAVRRAQVVMPGGAQYFVQCLVRRVGPLRCVWHGLPTPVGAAVAQSLRGEGPLIWVSPGGGGLRVAGARCHAVLDLTVPDLRSGLYGKWRNRLVLAERHGLPVMHSHDMPAWLISAERAQQRRAGYRNMPTRWIAAWQRYAPHGLLTLTAGAPDAPLAAAAFLRHGTSATYLMGWNGDEGRRLSAHNLLIWQAMLRLSTSGVQVLDLGLISPGTPGLNRFKRGTGASLRVLAPVSARLVGRGDVALLAHPPSDHAIDGNHNTMAGNATRPAMVNASATKKGATPLNTSCTLMSSRTPATTKQFNPIGGVIRQNSAILTTRMPNQMAHIGPDMPKALSAAETFSPPFKAITAG